MRKKSPSHGSATNHQNMLHIKKVSHDFKSKSETISALKNIDLRVKEREFVSVIGPSGCGKTTLLNIVAGYIQPSEGCITVRSKTTMRPGRDRIVINQENDLFDWMTTAENIRFGLRERMGDIDNLLSLMKLTEFDTTYPAHLSGGMKKRVSVARALAANPSILLMDEPFGSLDYQTKEKLQTELLKIWRATGATIMLVTHDIDEAIFLSNKIIVMSDRPATIIKEILVPFDHPRTIDIKSNRAFIDLRDEIRNLLTL